MLQFHQRLFDEHTLQATMNFVALLYKLGLIRAIGSIDLLLQILIVFC